jgi:hypothetical protein
METDEGEDDVCMQGMGVIGIATGIVKEPPYFGR